MIGKTFVFTFVNAYATFFYTAFVRRWVDTGGSLSLDPLRVAIPSVKERVRLRFEKVARRETNSRDESAGPEHKFDTADSSS